jgi:enoyl-CoA hydratase/carnithine racemase
MSATAEIVCSFHGGICCVELNRPAKRNALTMPMFSALAESLALAESRTDVKVILVTGAGAVFCAGHDLQAFADWPQSPGDPVPRFLHTIAELRKPMVLAVQGGAAGIGVTWMLHADWVLCSQEAQLRLPFIDLAIAPEAASSVLLARAVGLQRARCLLMGGEAFSGRQAHDWGLVAELAEAGQLRELALERARMLAAKDPMALRQIKDWLHPAGAYRTQIDMELAAINQAVLRSRGMEATDQEVNT